MIQIKYSLLLFMSYQRIIFAEYTMKLELTLADRKIRLFAVGELCLPQRGRGTTEVVDEEDIIALLIPRMV